jgi:hypothetical protein
MQPDANKKPRLVGRIALQAQELLRPSAPTAATSAVIQFPAPDACGSLRLKAAAWTDAQRVTPTQHGSSSNARRATLK